MFVHLLKWKKTQATGKLICSFSSFFSTLLFVFFAYQCGIKNLSWDLSDGEDVPGNSQVRYIHLNGGPNRHIRIPHWCELYTCMAHIWYMIILDIGKISTFKWGPCTLITGDHNEAKCLHTWHGPRPIQFTNTCAHGFKPRKDPLIHPFFS